MADAILDTDQREFLPLWPEETEEVISARWEAWANEGLTEEDVDQWVDTQPPSHWHISTRPGVREAARWYDVAGTEMVAAGIPIWSWGEYLDDHGAGVNVERLAATLATGVVTFTGAPGVVVAAGTTVAAEATDPTDPGLGPREFQVTDGGTIPGGGTIDLDVEALLPGSYSNAPAGAVTLVQSALSGVTVANAAAMIGGTDPESDSALKNRLLAAFRGKGPGNARDYEIWARAYAGVGRVTVIPLWDGPGTVKVIVLTGDGDPVAPSVVTGLQAFLDPVAGRGSGQAPVGPTVTVETATALDLTAAATLELETGYSLTGAGGTINLSPALDAAVRPYVEGVESGQEVVIRQVIGRLVSVPGVHDVGSVTLDPGTGPAAANVLLDDDPPQVASLQPLDLTVGAVP